MRSVAAAIVTLACLCRSARADDLTVVGERTDVGGRPSSRVGRADLDERMPRSSPDALRFEPGVFVQQTAHGQGSPFVRGRTGQQTLLLFDGIRLNNSTYRQGPNQYLFTVDARSVRSLEVLRGGASTWFGSDALGGVVHVRPLEPGADGEHPFRPRAALRFGSADGEFAERFHVDAQLSPSTLVLAGVGFRRLGRLRSGGAVSSPITGEPALVPRFEPDGRTMLGTGFRELTSDVRLTHALNDDTRLVAAAYLYRQYDAPRTDQCPAPFASRTECLVYDEQFRTLAYVAWEGPFGRLFPKARATMSYQRQHERRLRARPTVLVENGGRDDVDTFGLSVRAQTKAQAWSTALATTFGVGGDVYADSLRSIGWTRLTDFGLTLPTSRGQYVTGSTYATGGLFADATTVLAERLQARLGARLGFARADSPADETSGTAPIARTWLTHAGFVSLEGTVRPWLTVFGTWDRSFRAPNLDDLTSRQQTGPGFQFENAGLAPERADTFELGTRVSTEPLLAEAWVFRSVVHDAITRAVRGESDCPKDTPQCGGSWTRYQLINARGSSIIDGVELALRARLPGRLTLRATLAYAYGRGPDPQAAPSAPLVPLSRVAPLNGTLEGRWVATSRVWLGAALRWAAAQTRLAPSDRSDARIPEGGTPGFAVVDLRAGWRWDRHAMVTLILENVGDAAYRYHGSSINGPGRSVLLGLEAGL